MLRSNLTEARARFSRRLKAIRVPKGYRTARSFAKALDIDENRYTRYERGEVEPSLDLLLRMCELLGATPNDLLCDYIGTPSSLGGPGFAEEHREGLHLPGVSGSSQASPGGNEDDSKFNATAWILASELAAIETTADSRPTPAAPFERLQLTSEIFAKLKDSPFALFAGLATQMADRQVSLETQSRIYALVDELVNDLRGPG